MGVTCHGIFLPRSIRVRPNLRTDNEANRFTDEQIIGILGEHEAGAKCADLCRKHGMSEGTFYKLKAKYGGMDLSDDRHWNAIGPRDNGDAAEAA